MHLAPEHVRDIVTSNEGNQHVHVAEIVEIKRTSYSYTPSWTFYHVTLADADRSYLLLAAPPPVSQPPTPSLSGPITLATLSILLARILDATTIPVPRPVAAHAPPDAETGAAWLLLRLPTADLPTASLAAVRAHLSHAQLTQVQHQLGTHLRALHDITHDVFGVPGDDPPGPPAMPTLAALLTAANQPGAEPDAEAEAEAMIPYSWQDTFVRRLEDLVDRVCGRPEVGVDVDALRGALCRAIGSFLFEDVEIPRLVWVVGCEEDVIVSMKANGTVVDAEVAYIMPTFGHALWGDPLMEAWFMAPGPAAAISEGYFEGEEDGTLIVFARQKTKRTWYTVYLALLVLVEGGEKTGRERDTMRWAKNILPECVEILKQAPCY